MADSSPAKARSFIGTHVADLVRKMPVPVLVLGAASLLAGLAEAAILAILAQTALSLVDRGSRLHLDLGPLHVHLGVGELLAVGVGLAFVRLLLALVISYVPALIYDTTQARLRSTLFAAFTRASWGVQSREREGHLQELLTNHIAQGTQVYTTAAQLIVSGLTFLVLVITAVALNPFAALGIVVVIAGLYIMLRPLGTLGQRRAELLSSGYLAYAGGVNEAVRLAEEAHVFGAEADQRRGLEALIEAFRKPNLQVWWLGNLVPSAYQGFIYLLLLLALVGLNALGGGHIASLGAIVLLLVRSGAYGQQVQSTVQTLRQLQPYFDRLQDAERRYAESRQPAGNQPLDKVVELAFDGVSFSYVDEQAVLSDVSFTIAGGESIGIIGPSGAGKSTVVQILLGLRRPDVGQYLVNGRAAESFRRDDWRRHFAYVPQEPRLLHASVRDNIRFFRNLDDGAIEQAARLAGIHDDVMSWPAGYATIIGPRADAISGGQQQRICLARALAANPAVLVLDEPTSALDPLAEQLIQDSLLSLRDKLTLFVVAHRMSTLDICERVMVVVEGRLEAFGSIAQLNDDNPYYRAAIAAMASTR